MNNIWFIRTDKDYWTDCEDFSIQNPYIFSGHGSCGRKHIEIDKLKGEVFPEPDNFNIKDLRQKICDIKQILIDRGDFDIKSTGKKKCDLFIAYWIAVMSIGDIVFIRNKKQEVYITKIKGYISESFFEHSGSFQRPVEVLGKVNSETSDERLWKRTIGRQTLVRNANNIIRELVESYLVEMGC